MTHVLNGGCHCGALHLTFETPHAPAELPLRICTCSFCVKQGARYTADKDGRATFTAASSDLLHRYQFGTKTADILSCARCGIYLAAVTTVDGALYTAINVNARALPYALPFVAVRLTLAREKIANAWGRNPRLLLPGAGGPRLVMLLSRT